MEGEAGEFDDWELIHDSSDSDSDSIVSSGSVANLRDFDGESRGMIHADYFSLDLDNNNCSKISAGDQGSIQSDNPSWVDPESGVWPDSGSDRSDDGKFGEFEDKDELGFVGNGKKLVGFEGIGEMSSPDNGLGFGGNGKALLGFEEVWGIGSEDKFSLSKNELGVVGNGDEEADREAIGLRSLEFLEIGHDSDVGKGIDVNSGIREEILAGENEVVPSEEQNNPRMEVVKTEGERERKSVVWWKVPFELLKFCTFRVSPVWTFSMAAAVMGVMILTRRLYMMKKRSQALQLKATMNDKKVSQFMSRAERLNEAFSMVKRVPVIRPALPAAGGLAQWPVMSLR